MSALSLSAATQSLDIYDRHLLPLITERHEQHSGCSTYMSCCCFAAACFVKSPLSWAFGVLGSFYGCCGGITGVKNIYKACDKSPQDQIDTIFQKAQKEYLHRRLPDNLPPPSKTEQELEARRKLFFNISSASLYVHGLPLARDIQKCKDSIQKPGTPLTFECDVKEETQRQKNEYIAEQQRKNVGSFLS